MSKRRSKQTKIAPPTRRRPHRIEEDAERFFAPGSVIELPDWLVGGD